MKRVCKNFYKQENDNIFEMEICMSLWLNGCMRNDLIRLSKFTTTTVTGLITGNHATIHPCLTTVMIGNLII
jgi:hypothetical protein